MVSDGPRAKLSRAAMMAIAVGALGYFVDIYDLILFGTVRKPSLVELGFATKEALTSKGVLLLNCQMGGMLVGGILWGILGDKRGRLSVLFGSIITYSIANVLNGTVHSIEAYAACRVFAGIGLAGELGAGVTLVAELMDKRHRGIGTSFVAGFGICGGIAAGIVGGAIPSLYHGAYWRTAYYIGGGLGVILLILRIGVVESGMFKATREKVHVRRGDFFALFTNGKRLLRYAAVIGVGVPIWYVIAILVTFSDRLGAALGVHPDPKPATALMVTYGALAVGDVGAGFISQALRSRRQTLAIFVGATVVATALYFLLGGSSLTTFYICCGMLGLATGYWAIFVTVGAEQFGTNLRATAATTVPNFVRGSVVPVTIAFEALIKPLGVVTSAIVCGVFAISVAIAGLFGIKETFHDDLDYLEES
jgi:putative MFS transporter